MDDNNKCEHDMCSCRVGDGEEYCSPQCEAAAEEGMTVIKCDCRHTGCAGEA